MPLSSQTDWGTPHSWQLSKCATMLVLSHVQGVLHGQGTMGTVTPSPAAPQGPQTWIEVNTRQRQPVLNLQTTLLRPWAHQDVLLSISLTSAALGCTLGQNIIYLPSINMIHTTNFIHGATYVFNLDIIFFFFSRGTWRPLCSSPN